MEERQPGEREVFLARLMEAGGLPGRGALSVAMSSGGQDSLESRKEHQEQSQEARANFREWSEKKLPTVRRSKQAQVKNQGPTEGPQSLCPVLERGRDGHASPLTSLQPQ